MSEANKKIEEGMRVTVQNRDLGRVEGVIVEYDREGKNGQATIAYDIVGSDEEDGYWCYMDQVISIRD